MRILVVCRNLKRGSGITSWILNYYRVLASKKDVTIDLLVEEPIVDTQKLNIPNDINLIKIHSMKHHFWQYLRDWQRISQSCESDYTYVHIHLDNLVRFFYLFLLKRKSNVILHSHNSYNDEVEKSSIKQLLHQLGKLIVKHGQFIHFACSDLAAKWLFGEAPYCQINNGIDLLDFKYNADLRQQYLTEFNLVGKHVYGHIGRFAYQKNHVRLIKIFSQIYQRDKLARLVLIGDGDNKEKIESLVNEMNLKQAVLFLGYRSDVAKLLNMLDYIIFPSLYEGLPISLVEAQANGIPVFYSSQITQEVSLLPESFSFSLAENDQKIANRILQIKPLKERKKAIKLLKNSGYDKQDVINKLYHFYKSGLKRENVE